MSVEPKEGEIKTPVEPVQPEEKKPEGEEAKVEVEPTKEEIALWKKKSEDFDGLTNKLKLDKLAKKEETPKTDDEIKAKLDEVNARLANIEKEKADNSLTEAFKEFSTEMPWAIGDEYFDTISKDFSSEGLTKKEEIVSKLKALAISKFPDKFTEYEGNKIKSKVLAEASQINAGSGGGASNNETAKGQEVVDPLAKLKERFNSSLPKGFTATKK